MTVEELITELMGRTCRCGKLKRSKKTFCQECFYALPKAMQMALYRRIGEGYELAYERAVEWLTKNKK